MLPYDINKSPLSPHRATAGQIFARIDPEEYECTCSGTMIVRYQKRLSGPLLDRIDIQVDVPRVPFQKLSDERRGESSAAIRARLEAARARQGKRIAGSRLSCNADMGPTQIKEFCLIDDTARQLLGTAMRQMQLSARAHYRILKLALTCASAACAGVEDTHC